jgi:hypothetical protein
MLNLTLIFIACFAIFLIVLPFAVVSIEIIWCLLRQSKHKTKGESNYQLYTENQLVRDSIQDSMEDSQGDGLLLFDDPLFPSEED